MSILTVVIVLYFFETARRARKAKEIKEAQDARIATLELQVNSIMKYFERNSA